MTTERLIPKLTGEQRLQVIAAARTYLGVPFRHQGRTRKGMDCIGLLALSFGVLGYALKDRTDYGRLPADRKLAASLELHFGPPGACTDPPLDFPTPGDVMTFSWGAEEAHVGLVVDHPHGLGIIHSYLSAQRVVEHRLDPLWWTRIRAVYVP